MPSVEKALLKAAALDQVVAELQEAAANADKNAIGITASRDTMERLLARVAGYRTRIDRALEEGKVSEDAREPMMAVFRDLVAIVQDSHRALIQAAGEQIPFAAGIRKSVAVAQVMAAKERAIAARAEELEREEAEEAQTTEVEEPAVAPPEVVSEPVDPPKKKSRRSRAENSG